MEVGLKLFNFLEIEASEVLQGLDKSKLEKNAILEKPEEADEIDVNDMRPLEMDEINSSQFQIPEQKFNVGQSLFKVFNYIKDRIMII